MKTNELIKLLNELDPNGDKEVVVPINDGCGGPCTSITGGTVGFDWYHNKVCLSSSEDLVFYKTYSYRCDQLDNHDKLIYCRTGDYTHDSYITEKNIKLEVNTIIRIRRCGTKEWVNARVLSVFSKEKSIFPFPECRVAIMESKKDELD